MNQKKKICKSCNAETFIFSKGRCKNCTGKESVKKEKKPKVKEKSISQLKKELDAVFSLYIRQKYTVNGLVACYTCDTVKEPKNMQNGHFHSRSHFSVRWDEDNCRVQCSVCNVFKHGNYIEYYKRMLKEIGQDGLDRLEQKKNTPTKFSKGDIINLINQYKSYL